MRRTLLVGLTGAAVLALTLVVLPTGPNGSEAAQTHPNYVTVQPSVARTAVLDQVRARTAEVERIDRIEAKLTTWGDLLSVHTPGILPTTWDSARSIWVVALRGAVHPVGARGRTFDWAIYAFDATTGNLVLSNANSVGAWPAHFDLLVDRGHDVVGGLSPASRSPVAPALGLGRADAIEKVRTLSAISQRVDRVAAKLSTWREVQNARGSEDVLASILPEQVVWVVAVGGEVAPAHARGEHYLWGVMVFDAIGGGWLATFANKDGRNWPVWFDTLWDRAPR